MRSSLFPTHLEQGLPFQPSPLDNYLITNLKVGTHFFTRGFACHIYQLFVNCYNELGFYTKIPVWKSAAYWIKSQIETTYSADPTEKLNTLLSGIAAWEVYLMAIMNYPNHWPKALQLKRHQAIQRIIPIIKTSLLYYIQMAAPNFEFISCEAMLPYEENDQDPDEILTFKLSQLPENGNFVFTPTFAKNLYKTIFVFHQNECQLSDLYPKNTWIQFKHLIENKKISSNCVSEIAYQLNVLRNASQEDPRLAKQLALLTDSIARYLRYTQSLSYTRYTNELEKLMLEQNENQKKQCKNLTWIACCSINAAAQLPINLSWLLLGWIQCYQVTNSLYDRDFDDWGDNDRRIIGCPMRKRAHAEEDKFYCGYDELRFWLPLDRYDDRYGESNSFTFANSICKPIATVKNACQTRTQLRAVEDSCNEKLISLIEFSKML